MELKRVFSLLVVLFSLLLFSSFVSSATCPGGVSDTIMWLANTSNAHVEVYNQTNYQIPVCYSTNFGGAYTGPLSTPQQCTGTNTIGYVNNISNAHFETSSSNYKIPICYGDVSCHYRTVAQVGTIPVCPLTNEVVLFFITTAGTGTGGNAHVFDAPGAPKKVNTYNAPLWAACCWKTTQTTPIWTNASGKSTSSARVGETVEARITNYAGSPDVDFDIWEDDAFSNHDVVKNAPGVSSGADWIYSWVIDQPNVTTATSAGDPPFEFRFLINGQTSPDLDVTYCGDAIPDPFYEGCDYGSENGQVCVPEFPDSCWWCDSSCNLVEESHGVCGNGVPEPPEECDDGPGNTNTCIPDPGTNECTFCHEVTCQLVTYNNATTSVWTNIQGTPITSAEVGDTVGLKSVGAAGSTELFHIYEDNTLTTFMWDQYNPLILGAGDDSIKEISGKDSKDGLDRIAYWYISQDDYMITVDHDDYKFDHGPRYVDDVSKLSISLPGSGSGGGGGIDNGNDPINISLGVECGKELYLYDNLTIDFSASDPDDLLDITLEIGPNTVFQDLASPGGEYNYTHNFSIAGTESIRVSAVAKRNGVITQQASVVSNVIVIDESIFGTYVAACITEPANYEHIDDDFAYFNASASKAIEWDPAEAPTERHALDKDHFRFEWEFSDGGENPYLDGEDQLSYKFYKFFKSKGSNWAELKVSGDFVSGARGFVW